MLTCWSGSRAQGRGYQTRINLLLRAYMEEAQTQAVFHESKAEYDARQMSKLTNEYAVVFEGVTRAFGDGQGRR